MADKDVLEDAKALYELSVERENDNRAASLDDLKFSRLDEQWPERIKADRIRSGRPCLTMPLLEPFIRQVVNDARQNQPSIKVHPADSSADPMTAQIYNGLIRNIETTSRADVAYDTALDFAVTMGFGFFRVNTEFARDDTFDLDIRIQRIANPFSVYGDPYSTETDSSDWNSAFVTELLEKDQFRKKYKGAYPVDWDESGYNTLKDPWRDDERILIAEYFARDSVPKTILLLSDQSVVAEDVFEEQKDTYDQAGISVVNERETQGYEVTRYVMSGAEVLETRKWIGQYIPIIPVYGVEINVEGKRYFRGLVRPAKDAQRMYNYWRTATTELVALAPKAPFIGRKGQFITDAEKWASANVENHAFLEYDEPDAKADQWHGPPQRQPFAGVPAGALQEALNASNDLRAITGIHEAGLGEPSNETSGRAIMARQREGDVSTFHFIDNLSRAIEHCGRILIDLIPLVYTAPRIIRVLGPDGMPSSVPLGQPVQMPQQNGQMLSHVFDLSRGKYDLTVETGPSFTTRREESANQMIELVRAFPAAAPLVAPLLAKNLDWPGADQIAAGFQQLQQQQTAAAQQGKGAQGTGGAQNSPAVLQQKQQEIQLQAQDQAATQQLETRKLQLMEFQAQTDRIRAATEANESQNRVVVMHRNPMGAA